MPGNLVDTIWAKHVVKSGSDGDVIFIDLSLLHEVNTARAFEMLEESDVPILCPSRHLAMEDHNTPTKLDSSVEPAGVNQRLQLQMNCGKHQIPIKELGDREQGIVHVAAPELGRVYPNQVVVCCDSHTSTMGAFGALAFGIGTSQVAEVLASQSLILKKPKTLGIRLEGSLPRGTYAKDVALCLISRYGTKFGQGYAIEFLGDSLKGFQMDARCTLCNMSIEAGSKSAIIASDDITMRWLAEHGVSSEKVVAQNASVEFDREIDFDIGDLEPQVTWGTDPSQTIGIGELVPLSPSESTSKYYRALHYMDVRPGETLSGLKITHAFLGSCTNARFDDLEVAAEILEGRRVHPEVHFLVVPGSMRVWREAEEAGILEILRNAGADVRNLAGCSMCCGLNDDSPPPGARVISASNRNFEGRQGKGVRTHLASPATVAASSICGEIADPRRFLGGI